MQSTEMQDDVHDAIDELDLDRMLDESHAPQADVAAPQPARDRLRLLAKIPVRLTLEVGAATLPLAEVLALGPDSVLELDRPAGEPLVIMANGIAIGFAEVVVAGENYALRVIEMGDLDGLAT